MARQVPMLAMGSYLGQGYLPWLEGTYLGWGYLPCLGRGTYLGQAGTYLGLGGTYLGWRVPTLAGGTYLAWGGVPILAVGVPTLARTCTGVDRETPVKTTYYIHGQ